MGLLPQGQASRPPCLLDDSCLNYDYQILNVDSNSNYTATDGMELAKKGYIVAVNESTSPSNFKIPSNHQIIRSDTLSDLKSRIVTFSNYTKINENLNVLLSKNFLKQGCNSIWHHYVKLVLFSIYGNQGLVKFEFVKDSNSTSNLNEGYGQTSSNLPKLRIFSQENKVVLSVKSQWLILPDRRIVNLVNGDQNQDNGENFSQSEFGEIEVEYFLWHSLAPLNENSFKISGYWKGGTS